MSMSDFFVGTMDSPLTESKTSAVLKPNYNYAVNYKLNGKRTVNKYLYEHGYRFKNKDERNKFIMDFLATYDLPISLPNPNYKGDLNDKVINSFQASLHFSLFRRWTYQQRKVMKLESMLNKEI